jgi:hypothetical protein
MAHLAAAPVLFAFLALSAAGCPQPEPEEPCVPQAAVYTDIDETLTTDDHEWLEQLLDASYDPAMRPDADVLMTGYADLGYGVWYITARGEDVDLDDGRTAREATLDWLVLHGFPATDERLFLAPGVGASGDAAVAYKAGVIAARSADGWTASWAYGNAESDIDAFLQAGMPEDRVFLVGELAGTLGVRPVPDEEAFEQHVADHLPTVEAAICEEPGEGS